MVNQLLQINLYSKSNWSRNDLMVGILSGFPSLYGVRSCVVSSSFSKNTVSSNILTRSGSGAASPLKHKIDTTSMKNTRQFFFTSFIVALSTESLSFFSKELSCSCTAFTVLAFWKSQLPSKRYNVSFLKIWHSGSSQQNLPYRDALPRTSSPPQDVSTSPAPLGVELPAIWTICVYIKVCTCAWDSSHGHIITCCSCRVATLF